MDHTYVEENQIADRYVMGTLPAEEAERFESHYLSCPECLDRLELAESVQRGFKRMAGQDAAVHQLAVVAWLARLGRMGQLLVLLAFVLLPATIPAGLAVSKGVQLAQANSVLKQERQRSANTGALQAELGREREARSLAEAKLAQVPQPRLNDVIVALAVVRGLELEGSPAQRVHSPKDGGWIILQVPVDPPYPPSYRAVLRDGQGREVWQGGGLQRTGPDTLTLSFPPTLLPPGAYSVTIEPTGQRFNFSVLPPG